MALAATAYDLVSVYFCPTCKRKICKQQDMVHSVNVCYFDTKICITSFYYFYSLLNGKIRQKLVAWGSLG